MNKLFGRTLCVSSLLLASAIVLAQEDEPSKLPIEIPKSAVASFEAEATGKQFIPIIRQMLSDDPSNPQASLKSKISVKTPFGSVDLSVNDIAPLLEAFKLIHIVSYASVKGDDPLVSQEKHFSSLGMKRVALVSGSDGALIMRRKDQSEEYGIVVQTKGTVIILRTIGAPGLGNVGQIALEALARLVQQSVKKK